MYFKQFLIALTIIAVIECDSVPGIKKCSLSDSKCVVESGNAFLPSMVRGLPEYGVEPLDPHNVKSVDLSSKNLKLIVSDLEFTGFKNTVIQDIEVDKSKSKLVIKLRLNLQMEGKYEMKGNLLFLPLEGKGPVHVTVKNMDITVNTKFTDVERDGKTYWEVVFRDFTFVLQDRSTVVFENLFDGNDVLAGAAKEVIAASGNEIIEEVGSPLITDVAQFVVKEINDLFTAASANQLSTDYN